MKFYTLIGLLVFLEKITKNGGRAMSYDEMEQSVVWLYKFVLYSLGFIGLFLVGIFTISFIA